jgi:hypothetical protein
MLYINHKYHFDVPESLDFEEVKFIQKKVIHARTKTRRPPAYILSKQALNGNYRLTFPGA